MRAVRKEFACFTRLEKLFVFFAILTGFSISCEYGITRPASHALFLTHFSSQFFPWVWLMTVPLNLGVVFLYNYLLPKLGPLKILFSVASIAIGINLLCALSLSRFPQLIFFQYAWKDVYILLMFKQLWSMIHSTIPPSRAKYLYGIIFGMGTLGAIMGNSIPSFFALNLGSERLFFFTLPLYLLLVFGYWKAFHLSNLETSSFQEQLSKPHFGEGFSLIRKNRYLIAVLLLVVFMQVSIALMEYQFNTHLEFHITDKDLRTEYCGRLIGITNLLNITFQFVGGFLMVHTLGLKGSHFFIPLILFGNALVAWAIPSLAIVSFCFVFIKSIDYSLFGIIREMLYVPLQLDEKYRAKAVIDVFAYRTSKALVSLAILLLQFLVGSRFLPFLNYTSVAIFLAWIFVVLFLLRKTLPRIAEAH